MTDSLFDLTDLDTIAEAATRGQRVKKVIKNFGVELEVAHADGDTDHAASQCNDHFEGESFAGHPLEFRADDAISRGEDRWWNVVNDGSAGMGGGTSDGYDSGIPEEVEETVANVWSNFAEDWKRDYYERRAEDLEYEYGSEHDDAVSSLESALDDITKEDEDDISDLLAKTGVAEDQWWDQEEDEEEGIEPSDIELTDEVKSTIVSMIQDNDPSTIENILSDVSNISGIMDEDEIRKLADPNYVDFEEMAEEEGGDPDWEEALYSFLSYHASVRHPYERISHANPDEEDPDLHAWWHDLDPDEQESLTGIDPYESGSLHQQDLEFNSPRFAANAANIKQVSQILAALPQIVDGRTHPQAGLHVHMGLTSEMTPMDVLSMLYDTSLDERGLEREAGRGEVNYVHSNSHIRTGINEAAVAAYETGNIQHLQDAIDRLSTQAADEKYRYLNVASAGGKGTLEMRIGSSELADNPRTMEKWLTFISEKFNSAIGNDWIEVDEKAAEDGTKLRFNVGTTGDIRLQADTGGGYKDAARGNAGVTKGLSKGDLNRLAAEYQHALREAASNLNKEAQANGKQASYRTYDTTNLYHWIAPRLPDGYDDEDGHILSSYADEVAGYLTTGDESQFLQGNLGPFMDILVRFGFMPSWPELQKKIGTTTRSKAKGNSWANLFGQKRYKGPGEEIDADKAKGRMRSKKADRLNRVEQGRMFRGAEIPDKDEFDSEEQAIAAMSAWPERSGQADRQGRRRSRRSSNRRLAAGKAHMAHKADIEQAINAIPDEAKRNDVQKMQGQFQQYLAAVSDRGTRSADPRPFIRWANKALGKKVFEGVDLKAIGAELVNEGMADRIQGRVILG